MTKDKKVNLLTGAILAAALAMTAAFPASAKEERTPVGHITLNFDADVQAGDMDASVSVSVEDGSCSVESADFVNEQEYWAGGVKPKVEVWLSADSECYFSKSGKAAFTFNGDKVKYVSSATKYDKELLKLVVTLEKLDDDDEDLDVGDLYWDTANGIAHWNHQSLAKSYKVRLCKGKGSTSNDNGVGPTYTVKENSFDFSEKFPKSGNYYFKVRAVDIKGNMGDWEESPWIEVSKENILSWKGEWKSDDSRTDKAIFYLFSGLVCKLSGRQPDYKREFGNFPYFFYSVCTKSEFSVLTGNFHYCVQSASDLPPIFAAGKEF